MSLKVYYTYGNPRGTKIIVAAELANVNIEHINLTKDLLKKEEHLKRHPLGKVPVLQTESGYLFESNAILRFIARINKDAKLYGETSFQQGQVDQWLDFVSTEIEPLFYTVKTSVLGTNPQDAQVVAKANTELLIKFKTLDNHLKANNYLVGTSLTVADIEALVPVAGAFRLILDETARKNLPNLSRWFDHVANLPIFLKHFGRPRNCKTAFPVVQGALVQQQTVPKEAQKQEKQPHTQDPKQKKEEGKDQVRPEKKVQPKQGKKEQVKSEQTEQIKPKVQAEPESDEEKPAKKEANPLDLLPPSKFDIDSWKRQFLAAKDSASQKKELETFWKTFDPQGWSLWEVLYEKEPETEGKVLIKTNNTMNGFLQRSDPHFRKYAFAIHGVYGDEPNLEIRGAWLWRGTEVPQEMKDHPSFELHKFNRLDPAIEADRKLYEEYWLNQTEDESKVKGLTARTLTYYR